SNRECRARPSHQCSFQTVIHAAGGWQQAAGSAARRAGCDSLIPMADRFVPHPRLVNGHAMTLWAWARPRRFPRLPAPEPRVFQVARDARVLAHCHWQAAPEQAPTLLALHGLEGSSLAHYMQGLADKAYAAGFNVVRLNQRNCC